jgi:hypothetical protein
MVAAAVFQFFPLIRYSKALPEMVRAAAVVVLTLGAVGAVAGILGRMASAVVEGVEDRVMEALVYCR